MTELIASALRESRSSPCILSDVESMEMAQDVLVALERAGLVIVLRTMAWPGLRRAGE